MSKDTVENPGTNVKAKAGLNRAILNAGWRRFNSYCDYKFGNVILVDPKYTSQRCNQCGHTDKVNRKVSLSVWLVAMRITQTSTRL